MDCGSILGDDVPKADLVVVAVDRLEVVGDVELADAKPPLAGSESPPNQLPQPVAIRFAEPRRPVPPGVSIGHFMVSAGTSGFLATDGGDIFQFSNSHVLARYGDSKIGDPILQPGSFDGGGLENQVGALAGDVPM